MNAEKLEHKICRIRNRLLKQLKREHEDADASVASKYLKKLKRLPMTSKLLKSTQISDTVNKYRKATKHEVVSHEAKQLIKYWRNLVSDASSSKEKSPPSKKRMQAHEPAKGETKRPASSSSSTSNKKANMASELPQKKEPKVKQNGSKSSSASRAQKSNRKTNTNKKSDPVSSGTSADDPNRMKCCELLEKALLTNDGPTPDSEREALAVACASRIEAAVFVDCGSSVSPRYRTRIISRVQNLKDSKNPELREAVLRGDVSAEKFACMTSEEMASPELKQLRQKFENEAIEGSRMAFTSGTKSTLLRCKRCHKESVSYNQMQTLSSDEPMTTFCFCNECGFRWKFF